ncbi:MAG TPA: site-2 protease family protein [Pyrinomonadaceae bacterium]|nr:site-2 protease family protein [Pyrinomonadaceae bacterium]
MKFSEFYRRQIQVARVYGIPVRIDYRWFVVFALSVWLLASSIQQGWRSAGLESANAVTAWTIGIITTAFFFLSIFGHELAHALVGRAEGIETEEIVLHPFGGLARLRREPDTPRAEFRIAVAGPAASFIISLMCFGAAILASTGGYTMAATIFLIVGTCNFLLAIFNLLPGYPLDGGRVLRAFLWHRSGRLEEATRSAALGGQLIAGSLFVTGVCMAFVWRAPLMGLWSVLIGLFLWDAARAIVRGADAGAAGGQTAGDAMSAPVAVEPDTLVSHFVDTVLPLHQYVAMPVARAKRLHGILTLEDLKSLPRDRWPQTRVRDVMRPVGPLLFVEPSTPLERADRLMKENGAGAVAVVNGTGELVGFLHRGRLKTRRGGN